MIYEELWSVGRSVAELLGWEHDISRTGLAMAVKYPYAIVFRKEREMMCVEGVRHPDFSKSPQRCLKRRFLAGTSPEVVVKEIKKHMLPAYKKHIDQLSDVGLKE